MKIGNLLIFAILSACSSISQQKQNSAQQKDNLFSSDTSLYLNKANELKNSEREINLFFTQELEGKSEDCGCPKKPRGGIKRRFNYVNSVSSLPNKIFLDAGRSMFPWNEKLRKANQKMGYSAYNLGFADLDSLLLKPNTSHKIEFISSNLVTKDSKVRILKYKDYSAKSFGIKMRVTGLASPFPRRYLALIQDRAKLMNPAEAIRDVMPSEGILIVLSDMTEDDIYQTFKDYPTNIPIIVLGINADIVVPRTEEISRNILWVTGPKHLQEFGHLKLIYSEASKIKYRFENVSMDSLWN